MRISWESTESAERPDSYHRDLGSAAWDRRILGGNCVASHTTAWWPNSQPAWAAAVEKSKPQTISA
eukprot:366384-Chlamydomonas_euryale.AAC.16